MNSKILAIKSILNVDEVRITQLMVCSGNLGLVNCKVCAMEEVKDDIVTQLEK
jgi:hypothetical protein